MAPKKKQPVKASRPGQRHLPAPKKAPTPSVTPRIDIWQAHGASDKTIIDRLNGPKDGQRINRNQLESLGWGTARINQFLENQAARLNGPAPATRPGGGNSGSELPNTPTPTDPMQEFWDQQQQQQRESAFGMMSSLLDQYGLGSLTPFLQGLIQQGHTDPATLQLELQNRPEWKQRFKGNEMLRNQGLGVLSPAEYLNLERSYASVMRQFGMPAGFYDTNDDFVNFIGNGVSPAELAERAESAMNLVKQVDPTQRQLLSSMYGIGEGDIAAFFLDAKRAAPVLQKTVNAVRTAAAAKRVGIDADFSNASRFERLNEQGVTAEMAAQGYGIISNEIDPLKNLASIWGRGNDWTLEESERATFFNDGEAQDERRRLIGQERAAFSGASGFRAGVSGRRSSAGQF